MQWIIGKVSLGGGRHSLNFYDVICLDNLLKAWHEFKKGKRKKADVAKFEFSLEDNIFKLHEDLLFGKWKPDPYVSFQISDLKPRIIHKASVRDRVLFQAVYRKLYQVFDKNFIFDSYSSRTNKGTYAGVKKFEHFLRKASNNYRNQVFVLKCDVRKFFDSIDHWILINIIERKVGDYNLMKLVIAILNSFHTESGKGLPLGNVTSQLFANIYLNELDQFVKHQLKARYYIRYCDDFVIVDCSRCFLESITISIANFMRENLNLELHPRKVEIRKVTAGVDFLGYVSLPHYMVLRTKTKIRMFKRIKYLKSDFGKGKITEESLKQSVQSYLGILRHCKGKKIKEKIINIIK